MRIAFIVDNYLPDSPRSAAKMMHDLALEFQQHGHKIVVITPDHTLSAPLSVTEFEDITVWRFKSGQQHDVSKIQRAINESFLSHCAWKAIKSHVDTNTFDGIVYYSPSIFFGSLVKKLKTLCQCPSYLILRDLFPQWAIDLGLIHQKSLITKYFQYFERKSYNQADMIGLMSEKNLNLFKNLFNNYKCEVLRNWTKISPLTPIKQNKYREQLKLQNKVIYFYGGNIGHAQDMANLMRLAKGLSHLPDAHFLFVGQGDEVSLINDLAKEWKLKNFTYLPTIDQIEFEQLVSEVDVGLFSLAKNHTAHNFPGKTLSYMAKSLPMLGSVNIGNDLLDLINHNQAGYIHVNGDDDKLLNSAKQLHEHKMQRLKFGENGHALLEREFSVCKAFQVIEAALATSIK